MAIDRRDFLKFVVGGAVGTVISPLPWVSMDEVAKWSQRWAPIPEKGGDSYILSTCKLCSGGCGIRIRLIEGKRAVKIDGNPNHPVNRGGLCPLGLAGLQYLYQEDIRVRSPLKRAGGRGSGQWKPIAWEEALSEVTARLKELRLNHLSHTVAFLNGAGEGSQTQLAARFLKAYGSPNYIQLFQLSDLEAILTQTLHGVRTRLSYDLPRAHYILSFGSALLDGWGNPCWIAQAFKEWRRDSRQRRARVIQIDTMATTTASLADEWIAIKPDSEGVLALGLAQVMIEKGWLDKEFIRSRISGLEELKGLLNKDYTPDQVAGETTLDRETIIRLAKDFSAAKQPVALWGKGKGESPVSLFEAQAVHLLNLLVGSVNRPGGVYLQPDFQYVTWPKLDLDETARKGLDQPRLDGAFSNQYPKTGQLAGRFFANANLKKPYPINVLLINEANPVFSFSEKNILEVVNQIPFIVSFSSFMDETTSQADLILPASTFLERWDDSYGIPGIPFPVYGLVKPIFPPIYNTRSVGEAILSLAKNLGGSIQAALPFENMEEVIKLSAKGLFDSRKGRMTDEPPSAEGKSLASSFESFDKFWEKLVSQGTWYHPESKGESGKGRWAFSPSTLQNNPQEKVQTGKDYPFWMVPQSLLLLQSGYLPNPPFLTKYLGEETLKKNKLVVQIHPNTARAISLREGDLVEIKSVNGKIEARIHIFEGARPGCVFVPIGMGHKAYDPTLKDRGANPYPILDTRVDSLTGLDVAWATPVKIQKV
ncbi:MAG: molybdopterin-dependent oxidoreductase [Deltaproteobacteria bacterium]|nr:molybdopterin-dependent oxidoreductase [Deltaproteobacteria bacterium]